MSQPVIGTLWWIASNLEEAEAWQKELQEKGAFDVGIQTEEDSELVDVLIKLDRATANEVVGYEIEPDEWLEDSYMKEYGTAAA